MASGIDPGFLRSSDLFENQPDEVLHAVLDQGSVEDYGPGAIVFRQGDQGEKLYIVKTGGLEILAAPSDSADPRGPPPPARRSGPSCSRWKRPSSSTS